MARPASAAAHTQKNQPFPLLADQVSRYGAVPPNNATETDVAKATLVARMRALVPMVPARFR